jgi:general secretion pathway protein G
MQESSLSMHQKMKKKNFPFMGWKTRRGFTLIELLVVMAILGILAVVGLRSFRSSQMKARDAQRKNDLGQMQRALEAYYNDKGVYPAETDLPAAGAIWQDNIDGGALYMKAIPTDPKGGAYDYQTDANQTAYKILTHLENLNDPSLLDCDEVTSGLCGTDLTCNFGVASSNMTLCETF